ncbi:hypothetical protein [Pseudonocardia sp.]|uniref:SCO6745 family protein n=1 Tax=Pseudonocardia sp. TaxID=60912 RepID=UPI00261F084C|nr:hypothetical protein [Pseudonocardia sp.]
MTGKADQHGHRARRMWRALEPVHAVTYFAAEPKAACDALGTRGYWMSYFAQRAAPLGAAPPELVTALFYNFAPGLVARAVPDVWGVASPQTFLDVRLTAVDAALRRLAGTDLLAGPGVVEAAEIARVAALAAPTAGRALAAANAALPWPDAPHLVLWQAQTVLREHRGDGHVAALLTAGLDPVEALVLFAAAEDLDGPWLRQRRGWSEQEWDDASARLAGRDLLDAAGRPTVAGRAMREEVETHTDALADVPWAAVGDERAERLVHLVEPLVAAIVAGDGFLTANPMGLKLLPTRA